MLILSVQTHLVVVMYVIVFVHHVHLTLQIGIILFLRRSKSILLIGMKLMMVVLEYAVFEKCACVCACVCVCVRNTGSACRFSEMMKLLCWFAC